MAISDNIKKIRKEKNMTQKQLAEKAGLSIAAIQGYEQSKYKPKTEQLKRLAKALDVSVNDIDPGHAEILDSTKLQKVIQADILSGIDVKYPAREKSKELDSIMSQMMEQIYLNSFLSEQEINDIKQATEPRPTHSYSYKTEALESMAKLNKDGWQELTRYAKYLATNPKYIETSEE